MALDGITLSNIVYELNSLLVGGRIDKVTQPEKDEIILFIRNNKINYKLLMTSQANFPRIHLTNFNKKNPLTPPTFCMLLRKYLNNAKIIKFIQPNFERIVEIYFEHLNELGDTCQKVLIIEIMGRHSNIILCDQNKKIIDSIKHVGSNISSVREVYPGKQYVMPPNKNKINPNNISDFSSFNKFPKSEQICKALFKRFIGFSPLISEEICFRANINGSTYVESLSDIEMQNLFYNFRNILSITNNNNFCPVLYFTEDNQYKDFYCFKLNIYSKLSKKSYSSLSEVIDNFYLNKSKQIRINQKSSDIKKLIQTNIDRCKKKYSVQLKQIKDTEDREKYKIKGELIHANLYKIKDGDKKVEVYNYYTNENEIIHLNPNLTAIQNANKFFEKYNKKKRTLIALTEQIEETKKELNHLETIQYALLNATSEEDIEEIRKELMDYGYIKYKKGKKIKNHGKSKPLHFISSDGFHIYVGKNNLQNDELTLKFASSNDWWFHTKNIPGSHVIVKSNGKELTDRTFEEAASIAAYYSKAKNSSKVSVDYTLKKNIKKPNGSVPGFVIYHTNYSIIVEPSIKNIKIVSE